LQYTLLKLTSDNIQYLNAVGWSTGGAPGVKKVPRQHVSKSLILQHVA